MKFTNPFRWHVVRLSNGRYAVRRVSPFGWMYMDARGTDTWTLYDHVVKYCCFDNSIDAIARCKGLRSDEVEHIWP